MSKIKLITVCFILLASFVVMAQDKAVLIPKPVQDSPFKVQDSEDVFGQAYRWFLEGEVTMGTEKLRELISKAGYQLQPDNYYVVVANFTDGFSPIGMFHNSSDFLNTRIFGLRPSNLFYIFITRKEEAKSYVSVLATSKSSPFEENLLPFLSLFIPNIPVAGITGLNTGPTTLIDIRQFEIPEPFRKHSDISFIVKDDLSDEDILASAIFDNTSKERLSFGIATAITSINDVDIIVGSDGIIIIRPKENLDLATFAVLNYHFKAVDTKAKTFGNSFHLMGGIRLVDFIEPIVGVGGGFDLGFFDIALFAGYSVEFANQLESGFSIGQIVNDDVDPFKLKIRGKPRFGIQIKFP